MALQQGLCDEEKSNNWKSKRYSCHFTKSPKVYITTHAIYEQRNHYGSWNALLRCSPWNGMCDLIKTWPVISCWINRTAFARPEGGRMISWTTAWTVFSTQVIRPVQNKALFSWLSGYHSLDTTTQILQQLWSNAGVFIWTWVMLF